MKSRSSVFVVLVIALMLVLGGISHAGHNGAGQDQNSGGSDQQTLSSGKPLPLGPTIYVKSRHHNEPLPALPTPAIQMQSPPQPQPSDQPTQPDSAENAQHPAPPSPDHTPNVQANPNPEQSNLADRVMTQKLGPEKFKQLQDDMAGIERDRKDSGDLGKGAPSASWMFEGAPLRTVVDDDISPGETTPVFQGGDSRGNVPTTTIVHEYKFIPSQEANDIVAKYAIVPGGVVLEGSSDIGTVDSLTYDARYNAFIVGDRGVYFMKVPPHTLAVLCRAIAADDKVGVSLGKTQVVFGAVPKESELAGDLMLADGFLGDIAFAENRWTAGYRFAGGYEPKRPSNPQFPGAVFFRFSGFKFQIQEHEFVVSEESFDDRLIPLTDSQQPDKAAIEARAVPNEYEMNARHIADNIDYYRHERIIDETFAYGEVAAFIRGLKQQGVDLNSVADAIDKEFADE